MCRNSLRADRRVWRQALVHGVIPARHRSHRALPGNPATPFPTHGIAGRRISEQAAQCRAQLFDGIGGNQPDTLTTRATTSSCGAA